MREIYVDLTINKCLVYLTLTFEIKVIAIIGNFVVIYTQESITVPNMNNICQIYLGVRISSN